MLFVVFLLSAISSGAAGDKIFPFVGDDAWVGNHNSSLNDGTLKLLNLAGIKGLMRVKQMVYLEEALVRRGQESSPGTPDHTYQSLQTGSPYSAFLTRGALSQLEATKYSADDVNFSSDFVASFYDTVLDFTCYSRNVSCPDPTYRSLDGSCNNLRNPLWGMADTPLERLRPAAYEDGVWAPRLSSTGVPLPSPRVISLAMSSGAHSPAQKVNQLFVGFAHFVSHDLALVPTYKVKGQKLLSCCAPAGRVQESHQPHQACFPVAIPEDDPFYERHSMTCMNFVRSSLAPKLSCLMGHAEQLNSVSHFLDASPIYGVGPAQDNRMYKYGMMKVQSLGYEDFLPLKLVTEEECGDPLKARFCFRSGDRRVNQFVTSTAFYTLLTREHNRLARFLARINPHWDDERLFQESRRIVVACLQHITYSEFLPAMLGGGRAPLPGPSVYTEYDDALNPSVSNVFATAAFRFFHSLVPSTVYRSNDTGSTIGGTSVHYHLNNPDVFYHSRGLDHLIMGSADNTAESCDVGLVYELQNRLYQKSTSWGLDLLALDVQRSRDHGLPPYVDFLGLCSGRRVTSFRDLTGIPSDLLDLLERLYPSVRDVDPLVGMLAETPAGGALVGPTLRCILADQFSRLKFGDRFYYEHSGPQSFSPAQLQEVRRSSLASLICSNTATIASTPQHGFYVAGRDNRELPCHKLPRPNLLLWKESSPVAASHPRRFF